MPVNHWPISYWGAALFIGLGAAGAAWLWSGTRCRKALGRLAAEIRAIAHGGARDGVEAARFAALAPLPEAVNELCQQFALARKDLSIGLAGATQRAEDNAAQLAAVLNGLSEGVIVCTLDHHVVLYNQVAKELLSATGQIGLLRMVFDVMAAPPILHKLAVLRGSAQNQTSAIAAPFLAGSADGRKLLQTRMTLFFDAVGDVLGYVLTLTDAGPATAALARLDGLLNDMREELEARLDRLAPYQLASDQLTPDQLTPAPLTKIDESARDREWKITRAAIRRLTENCRRALTGWCPVTDVLSSDLFDAVQTQFQQAQFQDAACTITPTGLPVWLRAEPQSLALALAVLARKIAAAAAVREIDLAAEVIVRSYSEEFAPSPGDEAAWIDLIWTGGEMPDETVDRWLKSSVPAMGGMRVRDILAYHGSAAVTQRGKDGRAYLSIPVRKGREAGGHAHPALPGRPEYYDMSLLSLPQGAASLGQRPLKSLTYVVFDTETTGLDPSGGDEIVQIGGVRVVNGRILSGENFESLINPLRPIPPQSIQYHGITDPMVKNQPAADVVLPRFKTFADKSILVAHNAAFDLKFLRKRETDYGVRFDNPILDTMLMSAFLDGPDVDHSLDAICERYGIDIAHRHTALGDALVTAAVLLRQIDALAARDITTFAQTVSTLNMTLSLHHRQQAF